MARRRHLRPVGGGFHRYSTDAPWLVPHFEKMLYDNALLARLYLEAFQVTGDDRYRARRRGDARLPPRARCASPTAAFFSLAGRRQRGRGGEVLRLVVGRAGRGRRRRRSGVDRGRSAPLPETPAILPEVDERLVATPQGMGGDERPGAEDTRAAWPGRVTERRSSGDWIRAPPWSGGIASAGDRRQDPGRVERAGDRGAWPRPARQLGRAAIREAASRRGRLRADAHATGGRAAPAVVAGREGRAARRTSTTTR